MLRHEDETVRVLSLQIISYLHIISKFYFPGITAGSIKLMSSRKRPKVYQDCSLILHILPTYPFTETVYTSLFAFMLGIGHNTALQCRANMVIDYDIQVPEILAVILKLLLAAEVPLRQRVLEEIGLLLLGSQANRNSILALVGWQAWFLAIYTDPTEKYKDNFEVLRELVLKIMTILILHSFSEEKTGWVLLERTLAIVKHCSDRGVVDAIAFTRALFGKIMVGLKSDSRLMPNSNNNNSLFRPITKKSSIALADNFVHLVARLDDHVTNVYALSKNLGPNGQWVDMTVVRDCLHNITNETLNIVPAALTASRNLHTSKTKPRKSTLLYAAVTRITLRFSLLCLSEAARTDDLVVCKEAVVKLRCIISKDLNVKVEDGYDRLLLILAHTIRLLQVLMNRDNLGIQKTFVSLMKDILKRCRPVLHAYLLEKEMPVTNPAVEKDLSNWLAEISESCTIPDFCASVATSPRWNFIAEYADYCAKSLENEDKQFVMVMERRRAKVQKELDNKIENEDKVQTTTINKGDSELRCLQQEQTFPEQERRALVSQLQKESTIAATHQWRRIWRSLTNERAPWGTTETTVHWKLDKTESLLRMRLKLKRNYHFDEHRDSAQALPQPQERPKTEEFLSGIKLDAIGGDGDIPDEVIEEEDIKEEPQQDVTKSIFTTNVELVTPLNVTKGTLQITQSFLVFSFDTPEGLREKKWAIDDIVDLHLRRYLLRRSALEFFLADHTNYFLNFKKRDRNKAYNKICSLNPSLNIGESKPEEILKRSGLQQKWLARKISNFEYLMQLNTIAGRTYNDLTQYPVFPWVIKDYTSPTLDLNNPETFRDLSKPIGALDPNRLKFFVERYESFDDPNIPKFHYGTHYSSSATVLHYLVRMEPFTTLFLKLQGGKFDRAERMFDSIPTSWDIALTNTADVKELIPEFFYEPEFLTNSNHFNLGMKQSGVPLGDVQLPPWAATPQDFVRLNREALESEYVSAHLHEWIDLIFGFKQRGRAAVEAYNVFYYLTYEGAVDIDKITDPNARLATEAQIDNFGQTPAQLIKKKPHPARLPATDSQISIFRKPEELQAYFMQISKSAVIYIGVPDVNNSYASGSGTSSGSSLADKIVTIDKSRTPATHKWAPQAPVAQAFYNMQGSPFMFEMDSQVTLRKRIGVPFARDVVPSPLRYSVSSDGRAIFSCGHWDNSFKISSKLIQSVAKHKDIVTCLALSSDGQTLITGSRDTTLMVWDIITKGNSIRVDENPRHTLYGHDDEVTCVAINIDLDIAVSGSRDGTIIVHSVRDGEYVRTITLPKAGLASPEPKKKNSTYSPKPISKNNSISSIINNINNNINNNNNNTDDDNNNANINKSRPSPIDLIVISSQGLLAVYSQADLIIYLYSVNGRLLKKAEETERLHHMLVTKDDEYLITGGEKGIIVLRSFYSLKLLTSKLSVEGTIYSLAMTPDDRHLLVGLEEGKLLIITPKVTQELKST